jgi:hypothetical protein
MSGMDGWRRLSDSECWTIPSGGAAATLSSSMTGWERIHRLESRSKSPFLLNPAKSRSQKAKSDPNFAHFSDRIAVIYDATSTFCPAL